MGEPILNENMEKAQIESNLSITNNDINIELSKEFWDELQMNAYHGWIDEDMIDHIAKVLKMIDLIYIPGVDSHQLRMKVFPLSLANDARQWYQDRNARFSYSYTGPRERNIDKYWWRIYKSGDLEVLES
ncbi:hypothetical protein Tco_0691388 [Tanacetum coccineum]